MSCIITGQLEIILVKARRLTVLLVFLRIDKLEDELRTTRKKEQEETATLENVVQMVEENLRKTTVCMTLLEAIVF